MKIHPTAVIHPGAKLDPSVVVGPCATVDDGVTIGAETEIGPHAALSGPTTIGSRNRIGSFTVIGAPPQDLKYRGEPTELIIGNGNTIREFVSIHRGTVDGHGVTRIGDDNLIMAYVHIAHDCLLGNQVVMANAATLGGHVEIEDKATLGGLVAVHQFSRIGAYSYIGGMSGISKDVPPYVIASGIRNEIRVTGINKIGLRRHGFDDRALRDLQSAFRIIFRSELLLQEALAKTLAEFPDSEPVQNLVRFFKNSTRPVVRQSANDE